MRRGVVICIISLLLISLFVCYSSGKEGYSIEVDVNELTDDEWNEICDKITDHVDRKQTLAQRIADEQYVKVAIC